MAAVPIALALFAMLLSLAAPILALPRGFTLYFNQASCPPGFREIPEAKGRVIVSVEDPSTAGLTVGSPLANGQEPTHTHTTVGTFDINSHHIAADGCCNTQGAHQGSYRASGTALTHTADLPFTQLVLCAGVNESSFTVPFGTVAYFSPDVGSCPTNWTGYGPAHGRALIPGYDQSGPVPSASDPLGNTEDRVHNHSIYGTFSTSEVSYAGIDGCCNNDPSQTSTYSISGVTSAASSNVPYVQLLTCLSKNQTFDILLPPGALIFSPDVGCPDGWEVATTLSGRFLVALPFSGQPGLSFGGASIGPDGKQPVHGHSVNGTLTLPSASIGLASGCCAGGYARAGDYPYEGASSQDGSDFPYLMVPLCQKSVEKTGFYIED